MAAISGRERHTGFFQCYRRIILQTCDTKHNCSSLMYLISIYKFTSRISTRNAGWSQYLVITVVTYVATKVLFACLSCHYGLQIASSAKSYCTIEIRDLDCLCYSLIPQTHSQMPRSSNLGPKTPPNYAASLRIPTLMLWQLSLGIQDGASLIQLFEGTLQRSQAHPRPNTACL